MEFSLSPEVCDLRDRIAKFVREEIVPHETDPRCREKMLPDSLRLELVEKTKNAGLISPHAPKEFGGLGLNHRDLAVIFETICWSTLGAVAFNINAPDEGNVNLINKVGTPEQKERWLPGIVSGADRSVFSMTETSTDGAGSDPLLLQTRADEVDDGYVISGQKYMISGAVGANINIIMARTFDKKGTDLGATMFVADIDAPGFKIDRMLHTIDRNQPGGHAEVTFDNVFASTDDILGEVGEGFKYAQVRLAPARLTHCMRWLGLACRAHAIAVEHANRRHSFGKLLGDHQGVSFMLADNEIDLYHARQAIWHAAWRLDEHDLAKNETSICKVFCSEAFGRVVDRAMQILGSIGITDDTVIESIYRDIRPFRMH